MCEENPYHFWYMVHTCHLSEKEFELQELLVCRDKELIPVCYGA